MAALLAFRVLLAGVFLTAGVAKFVDLEGSRRAVVGFGVPKRLAPVVGVALPVAELAVGVALIPLFSARFGALGAAVLLVVFGAAIALALARGQTPDCHCFGQVHSAPASSRTLARNLALLGVAVFVAVAGWEHAGVSATHWVTRVGAGWLVAICAGVVMAALIAFQVWFSLQLLSQNGRALGRIQALESLLGEALAALGLAQDGAATLAGPLGYGLGDAGLPVGSPAPAFALDGVDGDAYSLGSLLEGRRLLLVFSAADCGPCEALMPRLSVWQRQHRERLQVVVLASGDEERNRANAAEHGLGRVLLQAGREVADAYLAHGTPAAVVIDPAGRIASPTVGGVDAIATLVAQATARALDIRQVPAANGHRNGIPAPDTSRVGRPAPGLVLRVLDGERVALRDLYGERTLALFWNPGCGFCQRMLADLKAFEENPPEGAPGIVVISAGDPDSVREQRIASTVLLDPEGEAMGAFGAGGTPMGVLIEDGKVASPVAAGADSVFELIHSSRVAAPSQNGSGR